MPLQFKNIAVGNLQDDVSGNNYAANKAVYILNLNNTLAQIFSDEDGTTPIIQDGVNNVTGVRGVFGFWVEAGDYFVQVGANKYRVSITGANYFNNRVDETVNLIVDAVAGRGAYYPVGSFEAGFTYTDINQVGTFGGTDYYIYTGGLTNLPHNVTAGTDPTLSSDYAQVFYGDLNSIVNLNDVSALNETLPRDVDLATAVADDANLGTKYVINGYRFDVVPASDTGGVYLPLNAGKKLKLIVLDKTASIDAFLPAGGDAFQIITDMEVSGEVETIELSNQVTVSQNITINKNLVVNKGGLVTPNNGVTVTLKTTPHANNNGYRIFDTSAGGSFAISSENEINEIHAYWFGITPYSSAEADSRANMKSIADALGMAGSLGVGVQAIGRVPNTKLPRLNFYIDAPTSGATFGSLIESYEKLTGYGDNTYIQIRAGADAFDVFRVVSPGANSIVIDNFQVDGNFSQQTNLQNIIVFETTGSPAIYCEIGGNTLYIKEVNGWGIWIKGQGLNDSTINPKVVRDCTRNALYVTACDALRVFGSYRTSKTIYANILFEGTGVFGANLHDVISREAGGANLWISNINSERGRVRMLGGALEQAGTSGAILDRAHKSGLFNVSTFRNANHGVDMMDCNGTSVMGGNADFNKQRGLNITRCNNCPIGGGLSIDSNSDTNSNVFDGITVFTSDNNQFGEIVIRNTNGFQRYGLAIDDAASDTNIISSLVDARGSGVTGDINDGGTGTIGIKKTVSGTQTVTVPSFGSFTFTITNADIKTNDTVTEIKSTQLDSLIYTATVRSGSVDVFLFNNTNSAINITNLNIDVDLISK